MSSISDHLCISGVASESGGRAAVQTRLINISTPSIVTGPLDICDPCLTGRLNTVGKRSSLSTGVAELMGSKPRGIGGYLILKRTYTKGSRAERWGREF